MSETSTTEVTPYHPPSDSTALDEVEGHAEHIRSHLPDLNRYLYISLELITELRAKKIISEEMAQEMHGYECSKLNIKAVGVLTSGVLPYRMFWDQFKQFCQVLWNPIQQRSILKFVIPKKLQNNTDYLKAVFGPVAKIEMIPEDEPVPIQLYIKQPTLQFCSLCDQKLTDAAAAKQHTIKYAKELITKLQLLTDWPADIQHEVEMAESGEGATVSVTCPTGQFLDKLMEANEKGLITDHLQEIVYKEDPYQNTSLDDLKDTKVEIEEKAACNARIAITDSGFTKMSDNHMEDLSNVLESAGKDKLLNNIKTLKLEPNITEAMSEKEMLDVLKQQPDSLFYKIVSSLLPSDEYPKYSGIVGMVKTLERVVMKSFGGREWPPKNLDEKRWSIEMNGSALAFMPGGILAVANERHIETRFEDSGDLKGSPYGIGVVVGMAFHAQLKVLIVILDDGTCHHLDPESLGLIRKIIYGEGMTFKDITVLPTGDIAFALKIKKGSEADQFAVDICHGDAKMKLRRHVSMVGTDVAGAITEIKPGILAVGRYIFEHANTRDADPGNHGISLYDIKDGEHIEMVFQDLGAIHGLATDQDGFTWASGTLYLYLISPDLEVLAKYYMEVPQAMAVKEDAICVDYYEVIDHACIRHVSMFNI